VDILPTSNVWLFVTTTFAFLLLPGPAVLYVLARSIDQGRKAGLASVLGLVIGDLFHVVAAALGLSAILLTSALAFDIVKYLGAIYLIYLGIRKLTSRDETQETQVIEPKSLRQVFTQGIVVNILNPKTALFFFSFLPQFVEPARGGVPLQILFLGAIFLVMALATSSVYALLAGTAGGWLRGNLRFMRLQRYFAGTVYIGLGITAALSSSGNRK
jgi:threonine/homoserine/homoserine lactone efflux protein